MAGGRGRSNVCEAMVMVMPWLNPRDLASLACTCGFLARVTSHLHRARSTDIARGLERWQVPAINAVDHHLYPPLASYCVTSFRPPPDLRHPLQPWGSPVYTTNHPQGHHDNSQIPEQGIVRALGPDNGVLADNRQDCSQQGPRSTSTDYTYDGAGYRSLDCMHINATGALDSETKKNSSSGDNGYHRTPNTNSHDGTHQLSTIFNHTCNNIITNQKSMGVLTHKGNTHHCAGSLVNHGGNYATREANIEKRNCICMEQTHSKNRYERGLSQLQGQQTSLCGCTLDGNVAYDEESRLHCLTKPENSQTENGSGMIVCVMECGPLCACDDRCKYRVTQHGLSVKVAVVRHPHKGWALHSAQLVSRGSFICEYAGSVPALPQRDTISSI